MDALPYYKWHWQRWRANRRVQRMSCLQKGIYRELLDECWAEGCIPTDPAQLADIAGCTPQELTDSWYALAACFYEVEPGKLTNKTLEEQRTEMDSVRASRARAGSASAKQKATLAAKESTRVEHLKSNDNTCHIEEERRVEESKEKPSRAKKLREGPTKTDLAKSRHAEFKAAILSYWQAKNLGVEMPWDGAEGRALEIWMRGSPQTTREQFGLYLRHRFKSDVNHTERPSRWIGNITNFAAGPIDRFNKPLNGGSNGTQQAGNNRTSPAQQRRESSNAGIDAAFAGLRAAQPARDDAAGASAEAQPGHPGGHGGDVRAGVGAHGEEVRLDDVPGRTIEGVA